MLRWIRYITLIVISGAAYAAPEINIKQSESSLPDLASETAQQEEQSNKGKSFKERGANYVTESAQQGFENLTPEALESQARSYLQGQITSSAQSYIEGALSPYGKVRSNLSIGQGGDLDGSSIDYFVPWYDNQSTVYFSQFSAQRKEERTIGNIGLGVRHNFDKWLLGGNIFYDYDFTRGHRRLGLGTEAWTDYLKFSGNYYHPLSEWKDSKDFDFYLERPARGWDVRAEAWLPSYPQLGSKIVFEQYYGDEVALIGTDNLEKDPYAVTLGVNYQPVPLLTVGTDYKAGTGDNSDLSVNATINYQFGVPLKDQLNSDNVKAAHSLMGSRHDFVERNNFIVLEYKEKDPLDVTLWLKADATNEHPDCVIKDTPEAAVGLEKCKWTINALINHHYKIVVASWQAKNNAARTLVMPVIKENTLTEGNNNHWNLVLPAWQYSSDPADPKEIGTTGSDTYTIAAADADRYIGLKITPTTTTGDPNVAEQLILLDLSTNAGGGSDSDDIPEGPVFDDAVKVVIHEQGVNTNLLGKETKLKTNTTYQVMLWKDKNSNGSYDTGEEVTSQYNYRWRFTGTSLQLRTNGGIVNPSYNNSDLVIPVTNAEAKTAFDYSEGGLTLGADGVQGYGLSIDYQRK
ncbi:TPA: inverse autotransporter beta domain-containing protein [Escherichia coli]|nr:inverse autotransporter beta domain-containing protein [Escherichia coli]